MYLKYLNSVFAIALAVALIGGSAMAQTASSTTGQAAGGTTPSAQGAAVYFINIKDGAKLPRTFTVQFGLRNMGLAPAGSDRENSGHHHLIIDSDLPPMNEPIPSDFNHLHFGAGQSEGSVTLPVGEHTLQLLFADKNHVPHNPPVYSDRIKVTVTDSTAPVVSAPEKPKAKQSSEGRDRRRPAGDPGAAMMVPRATRQQWCKVEGISTSCGYSSFQQCLAAVSGVGGHCVER